MTSLAYNAEKSNFRSGRSSLLESSWPMILASGATDPQINLLHDSL